MVDALTIIAIISGIIGIISTLTLHLRSACCNNVCSFDVLNEEDYKMEHNNN